MVKLYYMQVIRNEIKITRAHLSGHKEENMDTKLSLVW
jgi:hypothetical protein